jgi:hypothetical protein
MTNFFLIKHQGEIIDEQHIMALTEKESLEQRGVFEVEPPTIS